MNIIVHANMYNKEVKTQYIFDHLQNCAEYSKKWGKRLVYQQCVS